MDPINLKTQGNTASIFSMNYVHIKYVHQILQLILIWIFKRIIYFCYHSVITDGCQDTLPATVFLYCSLFFSTLFTFSVKQKNPGNTRFPGYLTFGHKLSCDNKSIFRLYYSTIVATRPEPTVRPPSRSRFWICRYLLPCFLLILCYF